MISWTRPPFSVTSENKRQTMIKQVLNAEPMPAKFGKNLRKTAQRGLFTKRDERATGVSAVRCLLLNHTSPEPDERNLSDRRSLDA